MRKQDKKKRLIYFDDLTKRGYHVCSIIFKDASIYITPPGKIKVIEKFGINLVDNKPIITYQETVNIPNIHATYHSETGLKHIRQDASGILAFFNTKPLSVLKEIFEPLLRIFPSNPSNFPFIKKIESTDCVITSKSTNHVPISFIFHATNVAKESLRIEAPFNTVCNYLKMSNNLAVVVTVPPISINDVFINDWPKDTLWTTPY